MLLTRLKPVTCKAKDFAPFDRVNRVNPWPMQRNLKTMACTIKPVAVPKVLALEPTVFGDNKGFFIDSFNAQDMSHATGLDVEFVQDNDSPGSHGVVRSLHCQLKELQGHRIQRHTALYRATLRMAHTEVTA